jgi:hypothetical protein
LKKNSFSTFFLITNNCQVKWARPSSEMDSDDNSGIFSVDSNKSPTTLQVGNKSIPNAVTGCSMEMYSCNTD